jgi:predicted MFS family arabinose efflux permease
MVASARSRDSGPVTAIAGGAGSVARARGRTTGASAAAVLFMCVFTSQAAVLVLSPILVAVARDFDVSTAVAGQLRTFAASVALVVAVLVARSAGRVPLRSLLSVGTALIAVGSIASAVAPSFVVLALAQVPLWAGVAVLVAGGVGAAGSWSAPEVRGRVVARALAGAPAAWIVGMPTIGLVSGISWRLAFLAVPLPAAVATTVLLIAARPESSRRPDASLARLLRQPGTTAWALSELLAMSAWAGTLVFSGALFVEAYGTSSRLTGVLLASVAVAYLCGNVVGGRIHHECLRRALARANIAAAASLALTWTLMPNLLITLLLFSFAAVVVAARTVVGTAYGFALAGERKIEVGAARAAVTHAAYLGGSFVGGGALAFGGHAAVGVAFALLFLGATGPYLSSWRARCAYPSTPPLLTWRRRAHAV